MQLVVVCTKHTESVQPHPSPLSKLCTDKVACIIEGKINFSKHKYNFIKVFLVLRIKAELFTAS